MGHKSRDKALRRMQRQKHQPIQRGPCAMEVFGFEIETGQMESPVATVPREVMEREGDLYVLIRTDPESAIPRLEKLIETYPADPVFKNWLTVAYNNADREEEAFALVERTIIEHPDYLFAKINLANVYLYERRMDEIASLFGGKTELRELYPERKKFHITEFTSFYSLMARCAMANLNLIAMFANLAKLKVGAPDSDDARLVEELVQKAFTESFKKFSPGPPNRTAGGRLVAPSVFLAARQKVKEAIR